MNAPLLPLPRPADNGLDIHDPELWPDVDKLVTEDDTPVDNPYSEKQMRLLTEPLYSSWQPPDGLPFRALANVGLYHTDRDPLVPDVMLGLGVTTPEKIMVKGHRAWFVWIVGKNPDVTLEIVSNKEGGEDTTKMTAYATIGVPYYVIHDPENFLGKGVLRAFALHARKYVAVDPRWLPDIGLGLVLWEGDFEDSHQQWLRWCDDQGVVLPTGLEKARAEQAKREAAEQARLAAEQARQAAEQARQAAEQARQAAERRALDEQKARTAAEQRAQQLAARLKELGQDVPE